MASTAAPGNHTGRWILIGLIAAAVVAALVWFGTRSAVDAVRPADMAFLKHNREKRGVVTTASGLEYEVLVPGGPGAHPGPTDTVAVQYEGRLIDGTVFDSTYSRGQPAVFQLDQVVPGWTEGLQLMTPGAKYRFTLPPSLGYGDRAMGGVIPANSVLVFDIELLAVRGK